MFGTELTRTASIAKMNMILAGDGHSNITRADSFQNPVDELYEIVVTNYPFAQKTRYGDKYPIPSRNGDQVSPQHCFRAVKKGGRMAFIAPEGFFSKHKSPSL
ncbi:MAG: SAM-dependent DNA methyltransferase [Anaerolineales bacterium]|uniref:N-6 DNA methylase n=1 Tax=Candidatus Villigracilis proximus TaxID=3140683 RepID=UPI003135D9C7|nr:SAM-dependent DNA methyltransferase [Anaerolineales bacterium]